MGGNRDPIGDEVETDSITFTIRLEGNSKPEGHGWAVHTAMVATTLYCSLFLVRPQPYWPTWWVSGNRVLTNGLYDLLSAFRSLVGWEHPSGLGRHGAFLVVANGLFPYLVMVLLRRGKLNDLGCRRPNRLGWRIALIGYVLSLPVLWWMTKSPTFAGWYLPQLHQAGAVGFSSYYLINMLMEHFFLQGVLLALFRKDRRWPRPPSFCEQADTIRSRALRWIGLAQPKGGAKGLTAVTRWLGLRDGCFAAVIYSGLLFVAVHLGKDPRELALSLPGGLATAYIAYRCNSWFVPFGLHVATAGTALMMIMNR